MMTLIKDYINFIKVSVFVEYHLIYMIKVCDQCKKYSLHSFVQLEFQLFMEPGKPQSLTKLSLGMFQHIGPPLPHNNVDNMV